MNHHGRREPRRPPPPPHGPPEPRFRFRRVMGMIMGAVFASGIFILPVYGFSRAYESAFQRPVGLPVFFAVGFVWSLAVYGLLRLVGRRFRMGRRLGPIAPEDAHRHPPEHRPGGAERQRPPNMFDEVMEALDRISGGDYDVHVTKQGHFHYSGLADKVNKLAADLSSVEAMRQEFVSNVSHEIQSPLTSISGFAVLLKKEDLSPEQRLHYLEVIEAESCRLSGLSENLLRLSVLDSEGAEPDFQLFRLDKQLEQVLLLLEPQWSGKEMELEVRLEPATVLGDPDLLGQVWGNLLHNAVKFTPPGGGISISVTAGEDGVCCTVADTGSGIPEESLPRIFERFYKVDKARDRSLGGNGLGLSIVKKIVDLHGGNIAVRSETGIGTTFVITLPRASGETE